jgi:hypothetical protein
VALEPADHTALGKQPGNVPNQLRLLHLPMPDAGASQSLLHRVAGECWSEQAALLAVGGLWSSRPIEQLMPDEQCRPQRAAGIARRRLNPHALERPLAK